MSLIKNGVTNNLIPTEFYLSQNYPNPFKEKTTIKYCVPYKTKVRLAVCNSDGELVEELVNEEKKAGTYEVEFTNIETHRDASLQSETYYCRLEAGEFKSEKKMTLSKESHN
jgi:hypothetical protein